VFAGTRSVRYSTFGVAGAAGAAGAGGAAGSESAGEAADAELPGAGAAGLAAVVDLDGLLAGAGVGAGAGASAAGVGVAGGTVLSAVAAGVPAVESGVSFVFWPLLQPVISTALRSAAVDH
jgi:hypothetical protein